MSNLTRADSFYRTVWGRDGWSDGRGARAGEYALIYGTPSDANGNLSCYPGAGISEPGCSLTTRRRVVVGGAFFSADAIAHEFGHGFLWDPTVRVRSFESSTTTLTGQGYLGEHVGDVIAALTQLSIGGASPEEAFRASGADGRAVRDNSVFRCEGYHLPPPPDPLPGEPAPEPPCDSEDVPIGARDPAPFGCREYTHMDFLANLDEPGEIHENSCMYSHVGYLLAQGGRVRSLRGVPTTGGISRELLAELYRKLLSGPHTSPTPDTYWDYATAFRNVVGIVIGNCATPGRLRSIPECDTLASASGPDRVAMTRQLAERFMNALWAEGFWSDPDLLSWSSDIAPVAVTAPAAGADPAGLYAFFVNGSDALSMVVYADPTDAGRTVSGPFDLGTRSGASVRTVGPMAVATDAGGGIHLAYVDSSTSEVRLLRRDAAGTWTTGSLPFATAAETGLGISVLADGRELIVAGSGGQLEYYFGDSRAVVGTIRSAFGALASEPSLTTISSAAGPATLLAFVSPDASPTPPRGRLEYRLFDAATNAFVGRQQLRVLASPSARSRFPFSLEGRRSRSADNLATSSCSTTADCQDFIGTRCVGFLGGQCEVKSCSTDRDCSTVAGTSGGGHVSCVDGSCGSFARFPITAGEVGARPSLLPFTASDGSSRMHVFVPTTRSNDATDPGGLAFANLVLTGSGGSIDFDEFHASRQVRIADDANYRRGYAATSFTRSTGERVDVVLGVDAGGRVRLVWRRSE